MIVIDSTVSNLDSGNTFRLTNDQLQREQDFYDERWKNYGKPENDRGRIELTSSVIPAGCNRILDVGCGDGRLSQVIRKERECFLVGFDLSMVALRQYFGPRCCGSASQLPFLNRSFDLVVTTEVLEHLPEPVYHQALNEISRVTNKYILISVPNQENLTENLAACATCGCRFHVWGHLHSYSITGLEGLFSDFRLVRAFAFGDEGETYNRSLLWVRQRLAGRFAWEERTVCYSCHGTSSLVPRWPFLVRVCDGLNARFWAPFFKRPGWLLGLYARREP
ncbi:MAG: class I SAM-dependent methyltransferase [Candidatus Sulfotelmatobacter sp.]|jgi:SAM-dependent methyltransferase